MPPSLSARRAWIEIDLLERGKNAVFVALRKESVDRNFTLNIPFGDNVMSLSARRAWIEMFYLMPLL